MKTRILRSQIGVFVALMMGFLTGTMEGARAEEPGSSRPCGDAEVCLAVRMTRIGADSATLIQVDQKAVIEKANRVWSQCGIGFFVESVRTLEEQYLPVTFPLKHPRQLIDLTWVLPEQRQLEVVYTKKWYGDLAGDSRFSVRAGVALNSIEVDTRADLPAVVFINEAFRNDGNVLAHEWGHVLGLVHRNSTDSTPKHFRPGMMYPSMKSPGTIWRFSEDECLLARKTARERWHEALR